MTIYAVIRKSDQAEVSRYASMSVQADQWPLDEFDHAEFDPEHPVLQVDMRITNLAFRNRFTTQEKITVELASLDNPAADMSVRAQSAALRSYLGDIAVAKFVDLSYPATQLGVGMLEAAGLIGAGRAAAILSAVPTAEERWNG